MLQKTEWIITPAPRPAAKLVLLCLPFAGGSSNSFRNWASILPPAVELRAVELPGHGFRLSEPLIDRLNDLLPVLTEGIADELDRPFALFGHSMGAILGYELTLLLQKQFPERKPVHVFLSGHGAPHLPQHEPPIHQLPEQEFIEKIKSYNGTPPEVFENKELLSLMIPILRTDFKMCETYQRDKIEKIDIPLTAMGGVQDPGATRADLEAWKEYTTRSFNVRMFPGDHFYLLHQKIALLQAILRDINAHFNLNG